jgi:hypothetical protein
MTLLFDVFTAYLQPLLQKHASKQILVWEDLQKSHQAANVLLQGHDNYFVSVRMNILVLLPHD